MANIRIRDRKTGEWTHEVAAYNTERTVDGTLLLAERWVLRSDGKILHRIRYSERSGVRVNHTSGYAVWRHAGQISGFPAKHTVPDALRGFLRLMHATILEG